MTSDHTYDVVEECGDYYIAVNDVVNRSLAYPSAEVALRAVENLNAMNELWSQAFKIEKRVAEAFSGREWPYGASCVNRGSESEPEWVLTEVDERGIDEDSVRVVTPDPTGYVQMRAYSRELYEEACGIVRIQPQADEDIFVKFYEHGDGCGTPPDPSKVTPLECVEARLAFRRSRGITIERNQEISKRANVLDEAGLMVSEYSREQYEKACEIMAVEPLSDEHVMIATVIDFMGDMGIDVVSPGIPKDRVGVNLAFRRSLGIGKENQRDDMDEAGNSTGDE